MLTFVATKKGTVAASLQDRVRRLEATQDAVLRAEENAMVMRLADFLEKHWAGACAANPELAAEDESFHCDVDAAALSATPPADYCPEKPQADRALLWGIVSSPELCARMDRIHETVINYAAQIGEPWTEGV